MWMKAVITAAALAMIGCAGGGGGRGGGSGDGGDSATGGGGNIKKGQVRTITGTLKDASGDTAVGAKTSSGKTIKGVLDPKTKKFSINLPKNDSAVISVKTGGVTKRLRFVRNETAGAAPGKADAADGANGTFEVPGGNFSSDADLGEITVLVEGMDIIIGDDAVEVSIFFYVDMDGDGTSDWFDTDDDGDGVDDWADEDWMDVEIDWFDEDDESAWDFFEDDDFCNFDEEGEICWPDDDEWFSEDECEEEEASEYCFFEGDEGFFGDEEGDDDWWNPDDEDPGETGVDTDLPDPDETGMPAECAEQCTAQCDEDSACLAACAAECIGEDTGAETDLPDPDETGETGETDEGGTGDEFNCEDACESECMGEESCYEFCMESCEGSFPS